MKNSKKTLLIGLCGLALAFFGIMLTKFDVVTAQQRGYGNQSNQFNATGIESMMETVYSIDFSGQTKMIVTGGENGVFYVSQIPVLINGTISNNSLNESVSNILGGDDVTISHSNNITVIGGAGGIGVGNSNATFFGGNGNWIGFGWNLVPSVLLGGENNIIGQNGHSNVIVGGSSNIIQEGAENVNILGGADVNIEGSNVVAGGQAVSGNFANSFVFNDGNDDFNADGEGAFFLNVQNGVNFGLSDTMTSSGAVSNGAIYIGEINIHDADCALVLSGNIGLMGVDGQCLVGCTSGSALSGKWTLLDHGNYCANWCSQNSDKCVQLETQQAAVDYTGFCTEGLVSTGNAHLCNSGGLNLYHNTIFETYLIDSNAICPSVDNQCVYQCNSDARLTGDTTGKFPGIAMCFKNCPLPWDSSLSKKHNETIIAYSRSSVNCSNGAGFHDTCAPYKTELMCVDGIWYDLDSNRLATTINTTHIYGACTLQDYVCDTSEYNLTRQQIINDKKDFMGVWRYEGVNSSIANLITSFLGGNITPGSRFQYGDIAQSQWRSDVPAQEEQSSQIGVRGNYKLCIDYVPADTPANIAPNNEHQCVENSPLPQQYHYKFVGCNSGYQEDNGVCRQDCHYAGNTIHHMGSITLFTGTNATCPDACHSVDFTCYDGTLYSGLVLGAGNTFLGGIAQSGTVYVETGCALTGEACIGFDITQSAYNAIQTLGSFTPCQKYAPSGIYACTTLDMKYRLDRCNENYYKSGNTCIACPNPNGYQYLSNSGSTSLNQCHLTCSGSEHVATQNGPCVPCGTGTYNPNYPNPTVNAPQVSVCTGCINKPENSHYTTNGYSPTSCEWGCNKNYYRTGTNNNQCAHCISGYYSVSGAIHESYCRITCTGGKHVATAYSGCEVCGPGTTSSNHLVSAGYTSNCTGVCPAAPANSHYITGLVDGCDWQCNANYYKVGTNECRACPEGYTSASGSVGLDKCKITCTGGNHVAESKGKCVPCPIGSATGQHVVNGGNISYCNIACVGSTNGNSYFTSNGSGGSNSCSWACTGNYYRNGVNGNKCIACEAGYSSPAGSTAEYNCTTICTGGNHVAVANQGCVVCSGGNGGPGYATGQHVVVQGNKSYCINCTKPANSSFTSNGSGGTNSCAWQCNAGYYRNAAATGCQQCPSGYSSNSGSTSLSACRIKCDAGTHVAEENGLCISCGLGETTTQHYVSGGNVSSCSASLCSKPANSYYTGSNCNWECKANYYRNGNLCTQCNVGSGYTSLSGSESENDCTVTCPAGNYVAEAGRGCVPCGVGSGMTQHIVHQGQRSYCGLCTNKPSIGSYEYTGNGTTTTNCPWRCVADYYRNGVDGDQCIQCATTYGYHSVAGSTSKNACRVTCTGGNHVAVANQGCIACSGGNGPGYATGQHIVKQGQKSYCVACTNGSTNGNSHFTNNGSGGVNSCSWECDAGYYREGNKCTKCNDGYSSAAGSESESACFIECPAGTHVETVGGLCVPCVGGATTTSVQYVHQGDTSSCNGDCSAITGSTNGNHYYSGENCAWECYAGYYRNGANGNKCVACEPGYSSPAGSTAEYNCTTICTGGNHVYVARQGCIACSGGDEGPGYATSQHVVAQGNKSYCINCTKPANSYFTSNGSGGANSCNWECNAGYYKNGNSCTKCNDGYSSAAGAQSESECRIGCPENTYVASPNDASCTACIDGYGEGYITGSHVVSQGNTSSCTSCGSSPDHSHYTGGVCGWECDANYYRVGDSCKPCPSGYGYQYTGAAGSASLLGCGITCSAGTHVAESNGPCVPCSVGYATGTHFVSGSNISYCKGCTNKPSAGAEYTGNGTTTTNCPWRCLANYYKNGNQCAQCNTSYGYTSPVGSQSQSDCKITCLGATHVAIAGQGCEACSVGYATGQHVVSQGNESYCRPCEDGPFNGTGYEYTSNGSGGADSCDWQCKAGYYLNGGSCAKCENGYTSAAGSESESACIIACPAGTYVATPYGQCVACPSGTTTDSTKYTTQGNVSTGDNMCQPIDQFCNPSKPAHSYYTGNNCEWECNADYYKFGTGCYQCPHWDDLNIKYTSDSGSTSIYQCRIVCTGGNHVATPNQPCVACAVGQATYQHTAHGGMTMDCTDCTKPDNSYFTSNGSGGADSCGWECDAGYYKNGNSCTKCKTGYSSAAGAQSESECRISCSENTYVASPNDASCTACSGGYITGAHVVSQGSTSSCTGCGTAPANSHYTGGVCGWECDADYYKVGDSCEHCPNTGGYQYHSASGSTSLIQCAITCPAGSYVAESKGSCVACPVGLTSSSHTVSGGNTSSCPLCNTSSIPRDSWVQLGNGTITICNPNDSTECLTMQDKNLGASEAGICVAAYGNMYQWGNNYGFSNNGNVSRYAMQTPCTTYSPTNYYSNSTFLVGNANWCTTDVNNLWGGGSDTSAVGYPVTNPTERKGPCPSGYHVPSRKEREKVLEWWVEWYNLGGHSVSFNNSSTHSISDSAVLSLVQYDFLVPRAGFRSYQSPGSVSMQGWRGDLWSSSRSTAGYASAFSLQTDKLLISGKPRASGTPVRCFKDVLQCGGTMPSGDGVIKGASSYSGSYTPTSWTYKANGDLGACQWKCGDGYTQSGNKCVTPQEAQCGIYNPSNFQDLDMYFITNAGAQGHYTLMDRNLGATQVYTGTNNICTYGYYYQWGNNYGFSNTGDVKTSPTQVNASSYGPNNYYSSDTFITQSLIGSDWSSVTNHNLWGGETNTNDAMKGPCPSGYHVPTKNEFTDMIDNYWKKSIELPYAGSKRSLDSLMPLAGQRDYLSSNVMEQGSIANYWSSTKYSSSSNYSYNFGITTLGAWSTDYSMTRAYGYSVRCFKNSPNSLMTIHPNGGTGVVIIVHGGVITKLGTPTKAGMVFQGWYSNQTFTSQQVLTGQTAPAHLYAKWGCDTGYVLSGSQCVTQQQSQCGTYNPSNFKNLDMYFVTDAGAQGHYTLMDRNLGATQVYTGTDNICTYGYYYQWGNNYGFPTVGDVNTSTTQVNASSYGPNNYYSGSTFIVYSSPRDWSSVKNDNLWGSLSGTNAAMQGPCPNGYHVPTKNELVGMVDNYWKKSVNNAGGSQWALDARMPAPMPRDWNSASNEINGIVHNNEGVYWTSTPYNEKVFGLYLNLGGTSSVFSDVYQRSNGLSLRCFKNIPSSNLNIHPNGGKKALIIVYDGVIEKLGTPIKTGATFLGWYSDSAFTSQQVQAGQTPPTDLYAKWESAQCGAASGGSYMDLGSSSSLLCSEGTPSNFVTGDVSYTWKCGMGGTIVNCSATRLIFKDLDMYFVTSTGAQGHYTLMDRNLLATAYMNERGKSASSWYGNFYQWGNNYGFANAGDVNTSTTQVDASGYGPNNYYSNNTFIGGNDDWLSTPNYNLWGGVSGTNAAMQGPCPSGYHVPTRDELVGIVENYWSKSVSNTAGSQRAADSLMPLAGYRFNMDFSVKNQGSQVFYWTSTRSNDTQAYTLSFNSNSIYYQSQGFGAGGFAVRCFKNSPNSNLTVHPNGGTGAVIVVHDGVITKLGTPTKAGFSFGGWYNNSTFTSSSQVTVGQTAPAHLYAKWDVTQCDNGYYKNGNSCVPCEAGYYCPGGNKYSCGVGTYSAAGADSCTNCPAGYTTSGENSTSVMQCYKEFTVTFDSNGATSIGRNSDSCKTYCTTASNCGTSCKVAPNNITRAGGTVLGWSTNPNATIGAYSINDQITLTADTTYYAITKKEITGTFVKGIGVDSVAPTSNTCTIWNTATSCTVTMADAYCSKGYYGPTWNPIDLNGISNNTTTTATCTQCPSGTTTATIGSTSVTQCYKQYTATFNKNGATSVGSESLVGTKYCTSTSNCPNPTVTAPTITRANWDKLGWSTSASATSQAYNVGQQITLTANTTFYAITRQVCNCGYTRTGAYACQSCPAGRYKNGTTYNTNTSSCEYCSNGPEHSYYISNGCTNSCDWQCLEDEGFIKSQDGKSCVCKPGTYLDSDTNKCVECGKGYTSDEGAKSINECYVDCECGTYVKAAEQQCIACPAGKAITGHRVYRGHKSSDYGSDYRCMNCTSPSLGEGAHYTGKNCSVKKCDWECDADYYRDTEKNLCNTCVTSQGYHSPAGSTGNSSCTTTCLPGQYVATPPTDTSACVTCPVGYASPQHVISAGTWSALYGYCTQCTNRPSNSQYTSYGTAVNPTNCPWQCNAGYYKNGESCETCPFGKTSNPGATSSGDCFKRCEFDGIEYNSGATIYKYLHATETCPTKCQQVTFTCHSDGARYSGNTQGTPSNSCEQQNEDPSYKLSSCPPEASCSSKSVYIVHVTQGCTPIRHTRYRIESCSSNMHSNGTYCCYNSSCTPKTFNASYSCSSCAIPGYDYEGSGCYTNYPWACFVSGTRVTMADGTKKNIEDVNIGDKLLGQNGINTVLELYKPLLEEQGLISINGGENFVTPAHPFMTTEGWKSLNPEESMKLIDEKVTLLKVGDVLVTEDGYEVVKSLVGMSASPSTQLYNFRVDGDNTYYANGYLVHNKEMHPAMCTTLSHQVDPITPIDPGLVIGL